MDVRIIAATHRQLNGPQAYRRFRQDLYFRLAVLCLWVPPLRERRDEIPVLAERFIDEVCRKNNLPRRPVISQRAMGALQTYSWPGNIRELRNLLDRVTVLCAGDTIEPEDLSLNQKPTASAHPSRPAVPGSVPPPSLPSQEPTSSPKVLSSRPVITPPPIEPSSAPQIPALSAPIPPPPPQEPTSSPKIPPLRTQLGEMEKQQILNALAQCGGNQSRAAEMLKISRRTLINRLEEYGVARPRKGRTPEGE